MSKSKSLKFDNYAMQQELISELQKRNIRFTIRKDGGVTFDRGDWEKVNICAHAVRDRRFKWYFVKWDTKKAIQEFTKLLTEERLRFEIEFHGRQIWFLLPREDEDKHSELAEKVALEN